MTNSKPLKPSDDLFKTSLENLLFKCRENNDIPREWRLTRVMVAKLGKDRVPEHEVSLFGLPVDIVPDGCASFLLSQTVMFGKRQGKRYLIKAKI